MARKSAVCDLAVKRSLKILSCRTLLNSLTEVHCILYLMASSVHNMRVRFETSLARSKDYVPLRKRLPSCVKVETEKDVKVETEIDNETYMEMNTAFPAGPESCVSYSTYISSPANYNHILPSYACSSVSVDLSLSRPGSHRDFPSASRPSSYGYPGPNPPKFDPQESKIEYFKSAMSKLPSDFSNDTSSSG